MLNSCIFMGRLTANPSLRQDSNGTNFLSFSIGVDRSVPNANGERETDFIDCVAWRKLAEHIFNYYKKGDSIIVQGRLVQRKYTDKDGNARRKYEISVEGVEFPNKKTTKTSEPEIPFD